MERVHGQAAVRRGVRVPVAGGVLEGDLELPAAAAGIVLFAHGSGSSRHSPRNRFVAGELRAGGVGTLLIDLLTPAEERAEAHTGHLRFDIDLLADRLLAVTDWLREQPEAAGLPVGYFGASTGAGAALAAAARGSEPVAAVVSRGGRPDLAGEWLECVTAPTLLLVGDRDRRVIPLNETARARLAGPAELRLVPGATHLFEEPGTLEEVARQAVAWFQYWLPRSPGMTPKDG